MSKAPRAPRERLKCSDCGKGYMAPLGVYRPHGERCSGPDLAAQLWEVRQQMAGNRSFMIVLAWWAKRQASEPSP